MTGRDDHPADVQRLHPPGNESIDKQLRRRLAELLSFACRRAKEERSILGDHAIEKVEPRKHLLQVMELSTGHQDQLAIRGPDLLESADDIGANATTGGKRTVVVAGEGDVAHLELRANGVSNRMIENAAWLSNWQQEMCPEANDPAENSLNLNV
jgi:hypothetical protein